MSKNQTVVVEFVTPVTLPSGRRERRAFCPDMGVAHRVARQITGFVARTIKDGEHLLYSDKACTTLVATITRMASF
jgi:hypothetical protein